VNCERVVSWNYLIVSTASGETQRQTKDRSFVVDQHNRIAIDLRQGLHWIPIADLAERRLVRSQGRRHIIV